VVFEPRADVNARRVSVEHVAGGRDPANDTEELARAVREGLRAIPKSLPCRFFYDEAGSALFEQICRLPEYYLTRTEDAILRAHAGAMVDPTVPSHRAGRVEEPTLIELGSGSAEKTRHLIAAALARAGRLHYAPIDVSAGAVEASARQLARAFPGLRVSGFVADYHEALADVAARFRGPKLLAFLGSSLGNYEPDDAAALLTRVARVMGPGDRFLLGTDLAKDASVLDPAYDDAQGVTARFNRNLLVRINRELGADFAPERFAHRAAYHPERGRVEIHLVSLAAQTVRIPGAGVTVGFAEGEPIHTENSHKYTPEALAALAARVGFTEEAAWTDDRGWYRVQRWRVRPAT
jgi:dimethylhistidine N-methyltransferase